MSTSSKMYSIRVTRNEGIYRDRDGDLNPEITTIYTVWRGEKWVSEHRTMAEARKKVDLEKTYGNV